MNSEEYAEKIQLLIEQARFYLSASKDFYSIETELLNSCDDKKQKFDILNHEMVKTTIAFGFSCFSQVVLITKSLLFTKGRDKEISFARYISLYDGSSEMINTINEIRKDFEDSSFSDIRDKFVAHNDEKDGSGKYYDPELKTFLNINPKHIKNLERVLKRLEDCSLQYLNPPYNILYDKLIDTSKEVKELLTKEAKEKLGI